MTCPSSEEYAALIDGDLEPHQRVGLEVHLPGCAACRRRLSSVAGELDPATLLLIREIVTRESGPGDPTPGPQPPPHLLERLQGETALTASWQPSTDPEEDLADPGPSGIFPRVRGLDVIEEIGRGGSSVVYRARRVDGGRTVALKVLAGGRGAQSDTLDRARRGARILAGLEHPNLARVLELGEQDGLCYGLLELYEGGGLDRRTRGSPWPPRAAAELVRTLAVAVAYVHEQGVIHRDLKPSNVLLDADGSPRIADFGIARLIDDTGTGTTAGEVVGSPCYMAPEQAAGRVDEVGPATDIHGLGAVLYEILTGRPPFRGDSPQNTLQQVRFMPPVPPSRLVSGIPSDLEQICLKCLAKAPSERYPDAQSLAQALTDHLEGRVATPVLGTTTGRDHVRPQAGSRLVGTVVAIGICGFVAGLVVRELATGRQRPPDGPREEATQVARAALNEADQALYLSRVELARHALEKNDRATARRHLSLCVPPPGRPDFRDEQWADLWSRCKE